MFPFVQAHFHQFYLASSAVKVIDGDTVVIQGVKVRMACIDAPEMAQPRGISAKNELHSLIGKGIPQVVRLDTDRFGRVLGILYLNNQNLNVEMVRRGYAFVYPRYLSTCPLLVQNQLINSEAQAKKLKKGIWQDVQPLFPWIFRSQNR